MSYKDNGALVGLQKGHYAILKTDTKAELVYDSTHGGKGIKAFPNLVSAKVSPKSDQGKFYADDQLNEVANVLGEIDVNISSKDISMEDRAILLGAKMEKGVIRESVDQVAPNIAFGFAISKSKGGFYYYWIVKALAQPFENDVNTKEEKISFQTPELALTGMPRTHDGVWRIVADSDAEDFVGEEKFFSIEFLQEKLAVVGK